MATGCIRPIIEIPRGYTRRPGVA